MYGYRFILLYNTPVDRGISVNAFDNIIIIDVENNCKYLNNIIALAICISWYVFSSGNLKLKKNGPMAHEQCKHKVDMLNPLVYVPDSVVQR